MGYATSPTRERDGQQGAVAAGGSVDRQEGQTPFFLRGPEFGGSSGAPTSLYIIVCQTRSKALKERCTVPEHSRDQAASTLNLAPGQVVSPHTGLCLTIAAASHMDNGTPCV